MQGVTIPDTITSYDLLCVDYVREIGSTGYSDKNNMLVIIYNIGPFSKGICPYPGSEGERILCDLYGAYPTEYRYMSEEQIVIAIENARLYFSKAEGPNIVNTYLFN